MQANINHGFGELVSGEGGLVG